MPTKNPFSDPWQEEEAGGEGEEVGESFGLRPIHRFAGDRKAVPTWFRAG